MTSNLQRHLGGSVIGTLLKLIVLSLIVGAVMVGLGLTPANLWYLLVDTVRSVFGLGLDTFRNIGTYVLTGAVIVNSVRCLPPENKPTPEEIRTCRPFLETALAALPRLRVVVALGQIAHQSAVKALGGRLPKAKFGHLAEHRLPSGVVLIDSYHCSRYNQNTRVLTAEMFEAVFARALMLGQAPRAVSM